MRLRTARFCGPRCPAGCVTECAVACWPATPAGSRAHCPVHSRAPRATRRTWDQRPRRGFAPSAPRTEIVDPLTHVQRPWQVPARVPPLGWLREPMRKLEVGIECRARMVPQVDERLDFRRIGVDPGVLSLEFGRPDRQADTVAVHPHADPVKGDHPVAGKLDRDAGKVRIASRGEHSCARGGRCRDTGSCLQNRFKALQIPDVVPSVSVPRRCRPTLPPRGTLQQSSRRAKVQSPARLGRPPA